MSDLKEPKEDAKTGIRLLVDFKYFKFERDVRTSLNSLVIAASVEGVTFQKELFEKSKIFNVGDNFEISCGI